jgi:hypothetical protein
MELRRRLIVWVGVLIAFAASGWHVRTIDLDMGPAKSDLLFVCVGARIMLAGESPYTLEARRELQIAYYGRPLTAAEDDVNRLPYVYPATAAIALAPLVALPWRWARLGFLLAMPLLTAASVLLWVRVAGLAVPGQRIAVLAALTVASWPTMWALRLQQPALVVAALVAAGCFLLKRRNDVGAGVLLAMSTFKPQTVCVLLAWLVLWAVYQRAWRFLGSLFGSMAALLLAAESLEPGWIGLWRRAISGFSEYQKQPALVMMFGHFAGTILAAFVAVGSGWMLWRLRRCGRESRGFGQGIALALAVVTVLLPTMLAMIYNQLFLIPGCLILLCNVPEGYYAGLMRRVSLGLVIWGFVATGVAGIAESVARPSDLWVALPFQNLLLPTMITVTLATFAFQNAASSHSY